MTDTSLKTYGADVFSEKAIHAFLPKTVAAKLIATIMVIIPFPNLPHNSPRSDFGSRL